MPTDEEEKEICPQCGMECWDWDEVLIHAEDEHPEEFKRGDF